MATEIELLKDHFGVFGFAKLSLYHFGKGKSGMEIPLTMFEFKTPYCESCVHWNTCGYKGCGNSNWCGGDNDPCDPVCGGSHYTEKQ